MVVPAERSFSILWDSFLLTTEAIFAKSLLLLWFYKKTQIKYARKLSCYHAMVAASIKRIRHMYFLLHDAIILANFETVLSTLLAIDYCSYQ